MRTVLDTSVVIGQGLTPVTGEVAISSVTLAELHYGLLTARTEDQRADRLRRLVAVERTFDALPIDEAVAVSYGRLATAVESKGRSPRPRSLDLLIAATAHAHDARVCTLNPDDLRGIEDLIEVVALQ